MLNITNWTLSGHVPSEKEVRDELIQIMSIIISSADENDAKKALAGGLLASLNGNKKKKTKPAPLSAIKTFRIWDAMSQYEWALSSYEKYMS